MTQEINRQEVISQLRSAFGFKGQTAFELGESVLPVALVEDCSRPPFHRHVGGVGSASILGVAAQFSVVGLNIPVGAVSNLRVVIDLIHLSCPGVANQTPIKIAISVGDGVSSGLPLATNANGSWDSIVGPPQARAGSTNAAAAFLSAGASFLTSAPGGNTATAPTVLEREWVLAPGFQLLCEAVTANVALQCAFRWREYLVG